MNYAPVVIPTLNRYEHFKNCIESLNKCVWADKTDVYIALDYPPAEKYFDGYNKIKEYLTQANFCFNSFHVILREKNYGVGGAHSNTRELLNDEIWPRYDRMIFSEDDNIFAPTFLQFMNYGLEVCDKREDILLVGGFAIPAKWIDDGNDLVLLNSNANAWGYGILRKKYFELSRINVQDFYHSVLSSKERKQNILKGSINDCGAMAWYIMNGNSARNDTFKSIYIRDQGLFCLFPKKSKVFNNGTDGSGQNSGKSDPYGIASVRIDSSNTIDPNIFNSIPQYYDETMDVINDFYHIPFWKFIWIKFVFITHSFWKKHNKFGKSLRKLYIKINPRL